MRLLKIPQEVLLCACAWELLKSDDSGVSKNPLKVYTENMCHRSFSAAQPYPMTSLDPPQMLLAYISASILKTFQLERSLKIIRIASKKR